MKQLVTILIPVFDKPLVPSEIVALSLIQEQLGEFPITFLRAESSHLPPELSAICPDADSLPFDDRYFESQATFKKLLLHAELYDMFSWSRFLLVTCVDTEIIKNELAYWCRQGYDLIQQHPDFERTLSFKDLVLRKINLSAFFQKYQSEIEQYDQKAGFSLRKVDTFAKLVKNKKRAIYQFVQKFPDAKSDALFLEYYLNRWTPQLIVPNAISRNRFILSRDFSKNLSEAEVPFAMSGLAKSTVA